MRCNGITNAGLACQSRGIFVDDDTNARYCKWHMPEREKQQEGSRRRCAAADVRNGSSHRCEHHVNFLKNHLYLCEWHAAAEERRCDGLRNDGQRCRMFESTKTRFVRGTTKHSMYFCRPKHEANLLRAEEQEQQEEQADNGEEMLLVLKMKVNDESSQELVDGVLRDLVVAKLRI